MLNTFVERLSQSSSDLFQGSLRARVERVVGMLLEVNGAQTNQGIKLGALGWLHHDEDLIACEVVGFSQDTAYLMALAPVEGVKHGAVVHFSSQDRDHDFSICNPELLLGRVINGLGEALDDLGAISSAPVKVPSRRLNPMLRPPISQPVSTGIKAIDCCLTVGQGQRLGLFAGSGVGKSVLLGMLARYMQADVVVVGLIGERGREVQEFVQENLASGLSRSVVVASPADDSPALRIRAAVYATKVAEYYRDQGKQVLLLMDSLTRVAQAQREIGLGLGEPATTKGYTPSAFAWLPRLVERAGTDSKGGAITAFYTVLVEEDDFDDPVVDAARAILDGHIVLDRQLAEQAIYPAINVSKSVSRLFSRLSSPHQQSLVGTFRQLWQTYTQQQDLITIGAYQAGTDPVLDQAINVYPHLCNFVRQPEQSKFESDDSWQHLEGILLPGTDADGNQLLTDNNLLDNSAEPSSGFPEIVHNG